MREVYTREMVKDVFEKILEYEKETLSLYEEYLDELEDAETVKAFAKLRDDELRNVELVEDLLSKLT